jgi:hypothetical protein
MALVMNTSSLIFKIIFWLLYTFSFFVVDGFRAICEESMSFDCHRDELLLVHFFEASTSDLLLVTTSSSLVRNASAHHQGSAPV